MEINYLAEGDTHKMLHSTAAHIKRAGPKILN